QRIAQISFDFTAFERVRHDLLADRAIRVVSIAKRQVVRRDRDRQTRALGGDGTRELLARKREFVAQLLDRTHGPAHLRTPIVGVHVGVHAQAGRIRRWQLVFGLGRREARAHRAVALRAALGVSASGTFTWLSAWSSTLTG